MWRATEGTSICSEKTRKWEATTKKRTEKITQKSIISVWCTAPEPNAGGIWDIRCVIYIHTNTPRTDDDRHVKLIYCSFWKAGGGKTNKKSGSTKFILEICKYKSQMNKCWLRCFFFCWFLVYGTWCMCPRYANYGHCITNSDKKKTWLLDPM